MRPDKSQMALGWLLVVLGVFFFLLNNRLLWFGWEAVWPIFPLIVSLFLLRVYVVRRKPRQLFVGMFFTLISLFLMMFSTGIVDWEAMSVLWPTFPLIMGVSLIVLAGVRQNDTSALIVGMAFVIFAVVSYMTTNGAIPTHVSEPVWRFWPLALLAAGALIISRNRRDRQAAVDERPGPRAPGSGRHEEPPLTDGPAT